MTLTISIHYICDSKDGITIFNVKKYFIHISLLTGIIVNLFIIPKVHIYPWQALYICTLGSIGMKLAILGLNQNQSNKLYGYLAMIINFAPVFYLILLMFLFIKN